MVKLNWMPSTMPRYAYRALVVLRNGKQVGLTGICAPYQKKCFRHCTGIMMAKLESIGSPIPKHIWYKWGSAQIFDGSKHN